MTSRTSSQLGTNPPLLPAGDVRGFLDALSSVAPPPPTVHPDVQRVLNIPRVDTPHAAPGGMWSPALDGVDVTFALLRPEVRGDPERYRDAPKLFPVQSRMLVHAERARGLVAYVGVGRGKTPVALLLPTVWNLQRPVLLTRASLVEQMERAAAFWGQWFQVRPLTVRSHHWLSTRPGAEEFHALAPDGLIIDEADAFSGKNSARTKTLLPYVQKRPGTRLAVMSGTLLRDSVVGPDHLSLLALRERSPLPTRPLTLDALSRAVDAPPPGEMRAAPGVWQPLCDATGHGDIRAALGTRLTQTVGVVVSQDEQPLPSLNLHMVPAAVPAGIRAAMDNARDTWALPDGQELKLALELFTLLRQLNSGFYYRPRWNTEDGRPDLEWIDARAEWSRCLTHALGNEQWNATRGRLEARAVAGLWNPKAWQVWKEVRDRHGRGGPPRETVWLDDSMLRMCADEVTRQGRPAVVWVLHRAVGRRLAELTGWPLYLDGPADASRILDEDGSRTIIASIPAHGTGRDLQAWSVAHWLEVSGSNVVCEQLLGRHHRFGQRAHCVDVYIWALTWIAKRALQRAEEADRVPAEVTQERRKLLYATRTGVWEREDSPIEGLDELNELFDDGETP